MPTHTPGLFTIRSRNYRLHAPHATKGIRSVLLLTLVICVFQRIAVAQTENDPVPESNVARIVEIAPDSADEQIGSRIEQVLSATPWFQNPEVTVDQGIVYLQGTAESTESLDWAETIAMSTEDVVAVVNEMTVTERSIMDLSPAWAELRRLTTSAIRHVPVIVIALAIALLTLLAGRYAVRAASSLLENRLKSPLLRSVASRLIPVPFVLLGLYLVLSILGLTGLAVTIIGGTGLAGLVVGFAFRDIAENFLASVLLSIQKPFATGDFIEVTNHQGFVQNVNTRSTLLMSRDGNFIQIPNASVYKNTITNYTANPVARYDFLVGIGYDDSISDAQSIGQQVLSEHPAVNDDPEPLFLVESLGAATVNLRAYFWIDVTRYSHLKVLSAVTRLVKQAFDKNGISMPDEAREVVFPQGVPIHSDDNAGHLPATERTHSGRQPGRQANRKEDAAVTAEGELTTDARELREQASRVRAPEGSTNLLDN